MTRKEEKTSLKSGMLFEEDMLKSAVNVYGADCRPATKEEDVLYGTDFHLLGVPCDPTLDWSRKLQDGAVELGRLTLGGGSFIFFDILFGYRKRNAHHEFEQPVLVLALDGVTPAVYRRYRDSFDAAIKDRFKEIAERGVDLFWEHYDALGETALG